MKQALLIACILLIFGFGVSAQTMYQCAEDKATWAQYSRVRDDAQHLLNIKTKDRKWWIATVHDFDYVSKANKLLTERYLGEYGQRVRIPLPRGFYGMSFDEKMKVQRTIEAAVRKVWATAESTSAESLQQTISSQDQQLEQLKQKARDKKCQTDIAAANSIACSMAGVWSQTTPGVGTTVWTLSADGTARERGAGNAEGKAKLNGNVLRIDWFTSNGYSGYYQWTLGPNCSSSVDGDLQFKTPRTDKLKSTVTKSR